MRRRGREAPPGASPACGASQQHRAGRGLTAGPTGFALARRGNRGHPLATIALYGPDDRRVSKLVVSIIAYDGDEDGPMRKWFSQGDVRRDPGIQAEALEFIAANSVRSVVMADRIIGCPHEEGTDYPLGEECPQCPFWHGIDRWTGEPTTVR